MHSFGKNDKDVYTMIYLLYLFRHTVTASSNCFTNVVTLCPKLERPAASHRPPPDYENISSGFHFTAGAGFPAIS
jgi:hypothetical protein